VRLILGIAATGHDEEVSCPPAFVSLFFCYTHDPPVLLLSFDLIDSRTSTPLRQSALLIRDLFPPGAHIWPTFFTLLARLYNN